MTEYLQVAGLAFAGGVVSLVGGAFLLSNHKLTNNIAHYAAPFAAGALLAAVFLDLLKDGIEQGSPDRVLLATLIGMILFFLGERFLRWFHHHHDHHDDRAKSQRSLIIIGDTAHNALDGVAIAAAFLLSPATGVVTAIAVAVHEIPQEIADFGLLLNRGMSRTKVLLVNLVSAFATVVAAVLTYVLGNAESIDMSILIGLSAGFLLYIAASDVIPELHEHRPKRKLLDLQALLLVAGAVLVGVSVHFAHKYVHASDGHQETVQAQHADDEDHKQ